MISTIDELRIPVVKGQENMDALLMQTLLQSFDELVTVDEDGFITVDRINLPNLNYADELRVINKKRVREMIIEVAKQTYDDFQPMYKLKNKTQKPFDDTDLQDDLDVIIASIAYLYDELLSKPVINMNVSSTAKVISAVSPKQALSVLLLDAKQKAKSSMSELYKDLRSTVKPIIDSGIRTVTVVNNKHIARKMTSAVESLMLDAIDTTQSLVFNRVDKELYFDGVEISVHFNSALDHAPIQGHQFSNAEFDKLQNDDAFRDYKGKLFAPVERAIGMWNCRHIAYPILLGVTEPQFTQDELDAINAESNKVVNVLGNSMTKRDALNIADRYLDKMAQNKEASIEAQKYGDNELSQSYIKKYLKYKKLYNTVNKSLRAI